MRTAIFSLILAAVLLFAFQVFLFGDYNKELAGLSEQVARTEGLRKQLRLALDRHTNISKLFNEVDGHLEAAYTRIAEDQAQQADNRPADRTRRQERNGSAPAALAVGRQHALPGGAGRLVGGAAKAREYPSGHEDEECVGDPVNSMGVVAAVVTVVFNRPDYLRRHAASLLAVHGSDIGNMQKFPLFFSQDGTPPHLATQEVAKSYSQISYLHHVERVAPVVRQSQEKIEYYRIAAHYRFVLRTMFDCFQYSRVIILEEDMELSPDFFSYFEALTPLLDTDTTLMCISSWNDHGQDKFVRDARQLYRSDFFPGLGWMLRNELWQELKSGWPGSYWDDWLRQNGTRKGRQCIRPEICRNYNFGRDGSSKGMFFSQFLEPIRLNREPVDWMAADLSYLELPRYDEEMRAMLAAAKVVGSVEDVAGLSGDVKLLYDSQPHYEKLAAGFGMLLEWRDAVPRGAYRGVVSIRWGEARVFFEPSANYVEPELHHEEYVHVDANGAILRKGAP
ncbi:g5256 [Coccomyxa elongata]